MIWYLLSIHHKNTALVAFVNISLLLKHDEAQSTAENNITRIWDSYTYILCVIPKITSVGCWNTLHSFVNSASIEEINSLEWK